MEAVGAGRHVAAGVVVAAHLQVELVVEHRHSAAAVAGGRRGVMLGARKAAAIVVERARSPEIAVHGQELLGQQHLVHLVHLGIGVAVVVFAIRVTVHRLAGIQLEAVHAVAQELAQMVEPVDLARLLAAVLAGETVLFHHAQVGVDVQPEAYLVAERMHAGDKASAMLAVHGLVRIPVRLAGEFLVIPLLVDGPVVVGLHPLRLHPHHVHRVVLFHELDRLVHEHEAVAVQVGAEAAAVSPAGQQIVVAGDIVVTAQNLHHAVAAHQVEVGALYGVVGQQFVGLAHTAVKEAHVGSVVQKAPSAGIHHEGIHVLGVGVGGEDAQHLAAMLQVTAAHAAAAVETLALLQGEA